MPDVSNEDLMKLIHRIIKKVEIIETKLDRLLEERDNRPAHELVDHGFSFNPIANDKELQLVTQKILQDDNYTENLRHFIENQKEYTLEHIFMPEYLATYNYHGKNEKKKLKGLVVFEQIYVYLKSLRMIPLDDIRIMAMEEVSKCKKRIAARKRKERHDQALASMEDGTNSEYGETEYVLDIEDEREPPCKIQKVDEIVSIDSDEDELDEEMMQPESEEVSEEAVYQEVDQEEKDDEETFEDGESFHPIKDDVELEYVTKKIQNRPEYLKDLRIQIVQESDLGQCSLAQVFTPNFLFGCTVYGRMSQKKKLIDMVPYKEVYFYLKSHMGLSEVEIEKQAMVELEKIKQRVRAFRSREKRKEILQK